MDDQQDHIWMKQAMRLAQEAEAVGEVPVGAIVVRDGVIIGRGFNRSITDNDPTAHAEIIALRDAAAAIDNYRLLDSTLYVTLEPCLMCAGAMVHSRISRLVYAATDPKTGVINSQQQIFQQGFVNHRVKVTPGVMADECSEMLSSFFRRRRAEKS